MGLDGKPFSSAFNKLANAKNAAEKAAAPAPRPAGQAPAAPSPRPAGQAPAAPSPRPAGQAPAHRDLQDWHRPPHRDLRDRHRQLRLRDLPHLPQSPLPRLRQQLLRLRLLS